MAPRVSTLLRRGGEPFRPYSAQTTGRTKGLARFGPINGGGRPGAAGARGIEGGTARPTGRPTKGRPFRRPGGAR